MAGSNNFMQHNPNKTNQDSDAAYLDDVFRANGIISGIIPSVFLNKALFQATTMAAALGQALANKGYTISDAVLADLITALSDIVTLADCPVETIAGVSVESHANGLVTMRGFQTMSAESAVPVTLPVGLSTVTGAGATCKYTNGAITTGANCAANIHIISASQITIIADQYDPTGQVPIDGVWWWVEGRP
jgi:hypothetical protein